MAIELVKHKKILEYSGIYETYLRANTKNKFWLVNTNKLIKTYEGMDGLKTGYTTEAKYCLTATAKRNNMRLIAIVMGEENNDDRREEITSLLDYGFNTYDTSIYLDRNKKVGILENDKSNLGKVSVIPKEEVNILNKKSDNKRNIRYELNITNNKLPIKRGDVVGYIDIIENGKKLYKINVTVKEDLKKANIVELFLRNLKDIITGENIF